MITIHTTIEWSQFHRADRIVVKRIVYFADAHLQEQPLAVMTRLAHAHIWIH